MLCSDCEYMKSLEASDGELIYFCMNKESDNYLEEVGFCSECNWKGYEDCGTFYHVTKRENLEAIKMNGLAPQIGENAKEWGVIDTAVFLFPSIEDLNYAMKNGLKDEFAGEETVILEIRLPESYRINLEYLTDCEVTCSCSIDPQYIQVLGKD